MNGKKGVEIGTQTDSGDIGTRTKNAKKDLKQQVKSLKSLIKKIKTQKKIQVLQEI